MLIRLKILIIFPLSFFSDYLVFPHFTLPLTIDTNAAEEAKKNRKPKSQKERRSIVSPFFILAILIVTILISIIVETITICVSLSIGWRYIAANERIFRLVVPIKRVISTPLVSFNIKLQSGISGLIYCVLHFCIIFACRVTV